MFFDNFINNLSGIIPKKRSQHKNDLGYIMTLDKFIEDAIHRYKIVGLPDTCDERIIMLNLLWRGSILFVDVNNNLISLPGTENGSPTIYGKYTSGYTSSLNGKFNETIKLYLRGEEDLELIRKTTDLNNKKYNGVCVHENWTRFPFIYFCLYYAEAIADTLRTIDVSRKNLKTPYIITAEESVIETVKKFFKNRDDNDDIILSSGVFPVDKISTLPLENTPESIRISTELIQWYEARFRELCGLPSNTSVDKKGENLIEAELDVTEDYAEAQTDNLLDVINSELDVVNKNFGCSMKAVRGYENDKDVFRNSDGDRGGNTLPNNNSTRSEKHNL